MKLEKMNKNFYREFFDVGDLVYDVGANIGNWTDACLLNGAGKVVAIEPQKVLVDGLLTRFLDKPVRVIQCALGNRRGTTNMLQCEVNTIASLNDEWMKHRFAGYSWGWGEEVMVITLNEVIGTYGLPKFVKIDVEGYELNVLRGLSTPIYSYCLEYTAEVIGQMFECINLLEMFGKHEYSYNLGDYPEFKCEWTDKDTILSIIKSQYRDDIWGSWYSRRII